MSRHLRLLVIAACLMFFAAPLMAQNATVLGNVVDEKGAPMVGVVVLLENKDSGFIKQSVTTGDGSFTINGVPPAAGYTITASTKDGDQIGAPRTGIEVNVGDEREILPPLRKPAPVAANAAGGESTPGNPVAPTPAAPAGKPSIVRNDSTTSISGVITGDQLRTLPLYNRNFLVLGLLTPNTHDTEAGSPLSGASFSISGQRASSNNFLIDGADNVASSSNQAIPFQVNDAIQEFRVTSSTANAEFGRGAGGVVSVVTQSGKNALHGSVFGYFANDALNMDSPLSVFNGTGFDKAAAYAGALTQTPLTTFCDNASANNKCPSTAPGVSQLPIAAAPSNYNQFVATAQDPLGSATNKFFAAHPCTNPINETLPVGPGNCGNQKFDPASILANKNNFKSPFDSKQFGANLGGAIVKNKLFFFGSYEGTRIDNPNAIFERVPSTFDKTFAASTLAAASPHSNDYALAKNILGLFPTANVIGVPGVLEFYQGTAPNYTNVHNALFRGDYKRSDTLKFNLRYAGQLLDQLHDDTLPEQAQYPGNGANRKAQNQNVTLTVEKTYKKITNEARFSLSQFRFTETPQDANFNAKTLGLQNSALQTILLSGLDTRYSGASLGNAGAYGGWMDSFWSAQAAGFGGSTSANPVPYSTTPMLPTLDGLFPFARLGAPLDAPSLHRDTNWSVSDGFTWALGKHSFKFGGDFRFIQNRVTDGGFSRGYIFSGDVGEFTADSETCNTGLTGAGGVSQICNNGLSKAFVAPSFDYALNQQPNFNGLFNSYNYSGYGQDSWKVHKKVTVNAGLRWEYFGVPTEVNNQIWNYDPIANGLVQQGGTQVFDPFGYSCGTAGLTKVTTSAFTDSVPRQHSAGSPVSWQCSGSTQGNIIQPDFNDFAGRLGIAYDVNGNGKTVIRAGAGLFYDQQPISYMSRLMENRPTQLNVTNPRYIYGQTFLGDNCFPQCGFGNATVNPAFAVSNGANNYAYDPFRQSASSPFGLFARDNAHSRAPYARQVNVTLQQTVTPNVAVEVGYVGDGGHRLPIIANTGYNNEWFCVNSRVVNPVSGASTPSCDTFAAVPVETQGNIGSSVYHSVMGRVRVVQFHGLRLNATYTWSKSTDNASSSNPSLVPTPLITQAFGLQSFGVGNPFGSKIAGFTNSAATVLGLRTLDTISAAKIPASIAGADTFTSSLTTTGAGQIFVSRYNLPQDPNNYLINDYGPSDFDTTHRAVVDYNYQLPIMKDSEKWGNWQVSGIVTLQSGQPFTVFSGPLFGEITQRVNLAGLGINGDPNNYFSGVGNVTLPSAAAATSTSLQGSPAVKTTTSTNCFYAAPASGSALSVGVLGTPCLGNSTRNQFTGPAYASVDMAIQKGFRLWGEGKELSVRAEAFNLLNRANFYNPISTFSLDGVSATQSGSPIVNPDFGKIKSAHAPLQLQLSARFSF